MNRILTLFLACVLPCACNLALPRARSAEPQDELEQTVEDLQERLAELEAAEALRADQEATKKAEEAKKPTVKWTGQMQADWYQFDQDPASAAQFGDIENGSAFRRARFGMFGDYGPTEYRIEMDFALAGRPSFLDVYGGVHDVPGLGRVRAGHFFEPFSLERMTPNRFTTFMERSLVDQPFAPARNLGVMANNTWAEENATWAWGMFRTESDLFGDDVGDDYESSLTGRVTMLPYFGAGGRSYFHLGGAASFRAANDNRVRFRSQPEARLGSATPNVPFFVDPGFIPAENSQLYGLEAALVEGSFSVQSEYILTAVNDVAPGSPVLTGWYAQASYFLTGEHRPYRKDIGVFDRVIPHRDFLRYSHDKCVELGPGAWEVAFRVSQLDLNDVGVAGGRLTDFTAGLNWYLNPFLRYTFNYIHAQSDPAAGVDSATNIFGMRLGYEF